MTLQNAFGDLALDTTVSALGVTLTSINGKVLTDTQLRASPVPVVGATATSAGNIILVGGVTSGGVFKAFETNASGHLNISDGGGSITVDAASLPLPTGAATEATLSALGAKIPDTATRPLDNAAPGQPVRAIGQEVWNMSFADSGASVLSSEFITPIVGTGITYNQTASALNVVAGTTANAEFLTRSTTSWRGSLRFKAGIVASQRIANNNFALLLADLVGSGLSFTINSATSVTVTVPGHTFTAQSVGQFMLLGGIVGAAGVPGRYAIASVVPGTSITFTVAGWPGSGSGTLTLFGHSYVRNLFTGVTATNVAWDAQRRGWASGDTTATINTTAAPGTVIHNELTGRECFLLDQLRATSTTPAATSRASRVENIPDDNLDLYVWIWNFNGTTAPASSTTFTLGFMSVEKFANTPVYIQGTRAVGSINPLPISGSVTASGTVTANIGTGSIAAGTNAIGDVGIQYRANATGAASVANVNCPATPAAQAIKATAGRMLSVTATNTNAATRWLKFWNTAAGSVTLGTTPAIFELGIPPNQTVSFNIDGGIGFATAITMAITGGQGLTNNTAVTLGDVTGFIGFA